MYKIDLFFKTFFGYAASLYLGMDYWLHPKTTDFFLSFLFSFFKQRKNKQIKKYYNIFDQYCPYWTKIS